MHPSWEKPERIVWWLRERGGRLINWNWLWNEWIRPLGGALVFALLIIIFIGQSFRVDGASMENTLFDGERLWVDKVAYRFRDPRRGEIIVLNVPGNRFIKRVIALAGDTIEERGGVVYVNGQPIEEPYVDNKTRMNWGPIRVPEGHLWVMGDNRPRSDDSRGSVGFLAIEKVVGRAVFRYWPLNRIGVPK
ncbi:MAG: signal peptidase I [Firmicutes bacterium]|nr:signal peptidase I [Bacillota bacterium]